ncbi:5'-methylthioadenosine nucleosidase [Thalassoglobus sp.]|uniref:phosphorylase family protein n=1 Tax=Thalassoglobus sp. TaxID=2795869 RepID=UPI003AA95827
MTHIQKEQTEEKRTTIGIVCALHLEASPLLDRLNPSRNQSGNGLKYHDCALDEIRVIVVEGAVGYELAAQAAHALIDAVQPSWILSAGLSGALIEKMAIGDLVVGNSLIRQSGRDEIAQQLGMQSDPKRHLHVGKLCTADHIVRTREEKRELNERTQAIAVDMESHAVAQVCKDRNTGFIAIRAISDDMSEDLPKEVLAIFGPKGTIRSGALVGTLFKRPSSVKDLWKIREGAVKAATNLAKYVLDILPQLAESKTSEKTSEKDSKTE